MILSAQDFDDFDRCPRRFAFLRTHQPRTISPLGLLYAGVEGQLLGQPDAIAELTSRLDVATNDLSPLSVIRHVEGMAEVIGMALRDKLGSVRARSQVPAATVGPHEWSSRLLSAHGGLHRLVLTSSLDDDSLRSFAHSWLTIGELAALQSPLTLLVVVIGAQRGGRRHSPWSKGFQHPVQKNLRFAPRKKDSGFTANWKTIWREQAGITAGVWLDRMKSDGVVEELVVTRRLSYKAEDPRMEQARAELLALPQLMSEAMPTSPMRRSSCDEVGRAPCPFQPICYSSTLLAPSDLPNLYHPRETPLVAIEV